MAFKIAKYWRYMTENVNVHGLFRSSFSSTPKMFTHVPVHIAADHHVLHVGGAIEGGARRGKLLEILPLMGIVLGAVGMGIHTAYHQIAHSPAVKISKENRSSLWELDRPDQIIHSADKFVNRSFFRRFGHTYKPLVSGTSGSQRSPVYTTSSYITATTTTDKLVN